MHTIKAKVKHTGFSSDRYLKNLQKILTYDNLKKIAEESIEDFKLASPTNEISLNWSYAIRNDDRRIVMSFDNTTFENGENIAILIDVGHGTLSGKWVPGTHYLNEPIKKTYERINNLLVEAQ